MKTKFFVSKDMKEFSVNEQAKPYLIPLEEFPIVSADCEKPERRQYMRECLQRFMDMDFFLDCETGKYVAQYGIDHLLIRDGNHYKLVLGGEK